MNEELIKSARGPDVTLVRRAQAGDGEAFTQLFHQLHKPVLNYIYRTVGDRQAAEDITQDAFIRAHERVSQLGPPWDFKSWVFRIIVPDESEESVFIPPLLIQPLFVVELFVSSGTGQSLTDGSCFDLDGGSIVSCGSGEADFHYDADLEIDGWPPVPKETHELDPRNGASFGEFGATKPTGVDCQGAALGGGNIDLDHEYYCTQTTNGKYGYIYITGANLMMLLFDWATYTLP